MRPDDLTSRRLGTYLLYTIKITLFSREVKVGSTYGLIMAKKKNDVKLPKWAVPLWEDMGSPNLSDVDGVNNGDLLERRHGLRKDDFVEVQLDARAFAEGDETWIRGRLLSSGKSSIEILCEDGKNNYIGWQSSISRYRRFSSKSNAQWIHSGCYRLSGTNCFKS